MPSLKTIFHKPSSSKPTKSTSSSKPKPKATFEPRVKTKSTSVRRTSTSSHSIIEVTHSVHVNVDGSTQPTFQVLSARLTPIEQERVERHRRRSVEQDEEAEMRRQIMAVREQQRAVGQQIAEEPRNQRGEGALGFEGLEEERTEGAQGSQGSEEDAKEAAREHPEAVEFERQRNNVETEAERPQQETGVQSSSTSSKSRKSRFHEHLDDEDLPPLPQPATEPSLNTSDHNDNQEGATPQTDATTLQNQRNRLLTLFTHPPLPPNIFKPTIKGFLNPKLAGKKRQEPAQPPVTLRTDVPFEDIPAVDAGMEERLRGRPYGELVRRGGREGRDDREGTMRRKLCGRLQTVME